MLPNNLITSIIDEDINNKMPTTAARRDGVFLVPMPPMVIFTPKNENSFSAIPSSINGLNISVVDEQRRRKRRWRGIDDKAAATARERGVQARKKEVDNCIAEDFSGVQSAERNEKADSPTTQHSTTKQPFIAWPPIPTDHLRPSFAIVHNFSPSASSTTEHCSHFSSRHRSSPATQKLYQPTAATSSSTSPLRHFQNSLRTARNIIKRREYSRVSEAEGEEEGTKKSKESATVAPSASNSKGINCRRNQQPRIRRLHYSSASSQRPFSSACPSNHGTDAQRMAPYKFDVILQMPELPAEELEKYAWDPDDRSINIYVKDEDRLTLHRHPVAQSTDCIRGKFGFTRGFHVWQLNWPLHQRGTHAIIGVATKNATLHAAGYVSLIGIDSEGWGWNIVENRCYHDSKNTKSWTYPSERLRTAVLKNNGVESQDTSSQPLQMPEKIYCILDMDEGQLSFATDSMFLGIAFCGLKGRKVYPIISAVWGHCEVSLKYIGGLDPEPRQLMDICRRKIRQQIGNSRLDRVSELNIPPCVMHYVLYNC